MSVARIARVLVVDDSIIIRAYIAAMLERTEGIEVVGAAASADEARTMIDDLRPNVVTLDIEMPGMGGLEFLDEIMRKRPTSVIMLSSATKRGAHASLEAIERGAVDCLPKPSTDNKGDFEKKLCDLVIAVANGTVLTPRYALKQPVRAAKAEVAADRFEWNGKIVMMCASRGGVESVLQLLPALPATCPPIVVNLPLELRFVEPLLQRLQSQCAARVALAADGRTLECGLIQLACDPAAHAVIDRWPNSSLRLLHSDPVHGTRPSASLLFATAARTAGANAIGVILAGMGSDGAAGLKALRAAGARTISQSSSSCRVDEAPAAARAAGAIELDLPLDQIAATILESCHRIADAA